ncbi:MAG TPA: MauE/DoxX family redox-associated membrane protein [Chloroflexota bacterium]|nr:MauE/DoxX family redox-associated membrane protein [Chloroflexota bacterium]
MPILTLLLGAYFAAVLGVSGIAKLDRPEPFRVTLRRLLPARLVVPLSYLVPWLELAVAASLLAGTAPLATAWLTVLLFATFLAVETRLVATGQASTCGCWGLAFRQRLDASSLAATAIQVGLALLYLQNSTQLSAVPLPYRLAVAGIVGGAEMALLLTVQTRSILPPGRGRTAA